MTARQLIMDTMAGRPTGRVPVAPFIFNNVVREMHGGEPADPIRACADCYRKYGFDIILRNYILDEAFSEDWLSGPEWQVETTISRESANAWTEMTIITTPERRLRQRRAFRSVTSNSVVNATREYFIKDAADFEQFRKYQPPFGRLNVSAIAAAREAVGEDGVTCTWAQGVFNTAERYRGVQDLLMDACEEEDFYGEMMEYFGGRALDFVDQVIEAGSDAVCVEGNIANGSMAGPRLFAAHVMPWENRLLDRIREKGCFSMYHNCGDGQALLPLVDQMHMDVYESLTPPPFGDTCLADALSVIRRPKTLMGNLDQIEFLVRATPAEIRRRVRDILELAKRRGQFILATSDYLSEGTPEENLMAFAEAAREFGQY